MILMFFWKAVHKFSACNKVQANFFYDNFFMSDRKQSIYFNVVNSEWISVILRIPQVSIIDLPST